MLAAEKELAMALLDHRGVMLQRPYLETQPVAVWESRCGREGVCVIRRRGSLRGSWDE